MATKRVSATGTVQDALKLAQVTEEADVGHVVRIPTPLDRAQYEAVDTFLSRFGGKWNRKLRGHVFPIGTDMKTIVGGVAAEGTVVVEAEDFFPTPPEVAALLIAQARLTPGMRVLEPSAGTGGIADEIVRLAGLRPAQVDVFEINAARRDILRQKGYTVLGDDFLAHPAQPRWDRVVMNPPFLRNAYLAHIEHAFACLTPSGRLVAVVSEALSFGSERPVQVFRNDFLHPHGLLDEPLPDGSFRRSGTNVNTRMIVLKKPAGAAKVEARPPERISPPAAPPQPEQPEAIPVLIPANRDDLFQPAGFSQLSLF